KIIREYLLSRQQRVCSTNRLFTPATWNTAYHLDIADMFTDLDLLKEGKNQVKEDAKPTTLKEVLDIIKSTPACKVLIEGEGGIGKSTLLRYVAYKWSTEQSDETFKGKILFLVNIRDIDVGETILDAILKQIDLKNFHLETNLPQNRILIERFIWKHNDIILLLDGLDELKGGSESPLCIFKNEKMYKCKVILTSRSENLNEFIKYSSIHVKVKGFDCDNINKYIKKHFAFFRNTELGELLIEALRLDTGPLSGKHREVYGMCKNPMLLLLVCIMWEENKHLPADKAVLFKEIFRCILNQFIDKQAAKEPKISIFKNTPEKFVKAMLLLGKCFYESLKKNQLSINKRDLEGPQEMVALALKLGFVYEDTPNQKSDFKEIFMTPHKLIVESLVGFYLYKLCQTEMLENECSKGREILLKPLTDSEWQTIRSSEYFHMARVFTIEFLGAKSAMFLSHWITNDISTYHSLMTYLEFVKNEHMDTVEKAVIDHMTMTDLEIKPHIYGICKSVRTFISYIIPNVELNQNEHFIQLMRKIGGICKHRCLNEKVVTDIDHYFRGKSFEEKFRMIAHIMIAAVSKDAQTYLFGGIICRICVADDVSYLTAEYRKLNFKYNITCAYLSGITTTSCAVHLLANAPQLTDLNLDASCAMNDLIREFSSRGVKLELENLSICDGNLSNTDGSSFASLFITPKLNRLNLSNCTLSGDIINDMIRECSSRGVKLKLKTLLISANNLGNIDGSLFASLFITPEQEILDLRDCTLSGAIINDMIRECSSRGVKLKLRTLDISSNNLSNIDGSSFSSLFIITPQLNTLNLSNCTLSGDIINDMIRECSSRGVKLELWKLDISNNNNNLSNIDGSLFSSLFIAPTLNILNLSNCTLSGDIINDMIRECSSRGVKFELGTLDISNNNLSNIDGSSFASLFIITPKLYILNLSNCTLSGDIINDMIRECSSRGVRLEIWLSIDISGNNLSNIDGSSFASLFITPKLNVLNLSNCTLSGDIINDVIRECLSRGVKLELGSLDISNNNLSNIDGSSFASLFIITPILNRLFLCNCTLSGDIINDMIRECSSRGVKLVLKYLDISSNNLSNFDGSSFASLFIITPILNRLFLCNCTLSGDIINDMIRECSSRGVKLDLSTLDISSNNLSNIDGSSFSSLFIITPNLIELNLSNCTLSGDIINDMIRECSMRGVKLKLGSLDISSNNLSNFDGSSFASLFIITPTLNMLNLSNCTLSGAIINDMIRECSMRGVKLKLGSLDISSNNLSNIDGSSFAS
ncbi:uncharacterized protein LOC117116218, partial [Anneissia japonica]|uniref:uncharacterized protein LOC117116218 n=1 Tax=Anneissia japonica TaxID=1529436 RepID=UPI001425630A